MSLFLSFIFLACKVNYEKMSWCKLFQLGGGRKYFTDRKIINTYNKFSYVLTQTPKKNCRLSAKYYHSKFGSIEQSFALISISLIPCLLLQDFFFPPPENATNIFRSPKILWILYFIATVSAILTFISGISRMSDYDCQ